MKLYRRKPSYAMAMPVVTDDNSIEYALQPCDESGKPLSSHMEFLTGEDFTRAWEAYRVRNKPKSKTPPSRRRNGPTKREMLKTIVNEQESETTNA